MPGFVSRIWNESDSSVRTRLVGLYALLIGANVLVWIWAFVALRDNAVLFGSAFLAYTFGLRHAVDADHIAAIDNSTRKLMQQGQRPVGVGFFFSLGHSLVVVPAVDRGRLRSCAGHRAVRRPQGLRRRRRHARLGGVPVSAGGVQHRGADLGLADVSGGQARRAFLRGRFRHAAQQPRLSLAAVPAAVQASSTKSWHLFPIGFLFGLGFDTATEVALFGISATQAANGASFGTLLVFPALFTAGMTLIDSTDGVLMLGAYGWAFMKPIRKLYYNITITAVSVIVAVLIGGIETLGLIGDTFKLEGPFWDAIGALNDNFGVLGYVIIGVFALSWLVSVLIYRAKGYDKIDVGASA